MTGPVWAEEIHLIEAESTEQLGQRLSEDLVAGDLVVLGGELGAGKTTLTRGLGRGLGVRGAVTSPTFVIARVHPPLQDGPPLVHVDAYRLGSLAEIDDLDLDTDMAESVTVVEWGAGLVEGLAPDRLEITLLRSRGFNPDHGREVDTRTAHVQAFGPSWVSRPLQFWEPDGTVAPRALDPLRLRDITRRVAATWTAWDADVQSVELVGQVFEVRFGWAGRSEMFGVRVPVPATTAAPIWTRWGVTSMHEWATMLVVQLMEDMDTGAPDRVQRQVEDGVSWLQLAALS